MKRTNLTAPSLMWATIRIVFALVLISISIPAQSTARYRLTVRNTWSKTTHPGNFPNDAHFSWLAGGTHNATVSIWAPGKLASPGMVQMAETGFTTILESEVKKAKGPAGAVLAWHHWFCPKGTVVAKCGALVVEFDVHDRHPLVSLASMLGPSPDWFVGVSALPLRVNGQWRPKVVVDLRPYDGGSRSANRWALFGPRNMPQAPITRITAASRQLVGPGSLGSFTFELLPRFRTFGASCGLSLNAATGSKPAIGTTLTLVTRNVPNSATSALLTAGVSKTRIRGVPLPLDLGFMGLKGCFLYHSLDGIWSFPVQNRTGQLSIPIPNNLALIGATVYFQSVAGSVTSNGGEVQVGSR